MSKEAMRNLNKLFKEIRGKPMTKEQKAFLEVLRAKVKTKERLSRK